MEIILQGKDRNKMKRLLSYRLANLQGQGKRDYQEDSFAFANALDVTMIRERGLLAVVADGMGGMDGGRQSGEIAVRTVLDDFSSMDTGGDISSQLTDMAGHASDRVNDAIGGSGGCTLIAAVIYDEELSFVSVGDSFIWLLRKGELIKLNHEHNRKNEIYLETIRAGDTDPAEGRENFEASALTQFIGMTGMDEIDGTRMPMPLEDGDILVLCSDGVGGVLTEDEVITCLSNKPPDNAALAIDGLIKQKDRELQDNYTALIIKCGY